MADREIACAAVGLGHIIGTVIVWCEPVTLRPRSWPTATGLAVGVNGARPSARALTPRPDGHKAPPGQLIITASDDQNRWI
jgi:hypothetical protein